jgi:nucleotide-binding universal stress UspA family protein
MTPACPRPVIAGIDGSVNSRRAAQLAADEARRRLAPLRLITALPSHVHDVVTVGAEPDLPAVLLGDATEVLRSVAADVSDAASAGQVTWEVVEGRPVEALRRASAEAQLVVLGSRGVGGVAGLLLGSTASGVVATAACPVVVLPDETTVSVSRRRSVVVGVEGRPGDEEVIRFAFDEAAALGTDLVAVHTWQDIALESAYQSVSPLVDWAGVRADEERVLAEALAGWADKQPDVEVREVVIRDRTARGLLAAALTAQLLVVGHRRRNRVVTLTSTTHGVLHRAPCPVAVVPVGLEPEV